ncbi:MAG: tetratricopeptide repeat protein [Alphaproteobacteria bacterium]
MSADDVATLFREAHGRHVDGDLAAAERGYRRILDMAPRHAPALHYLGVVAHQSGHHQASAALIEESLAIEPASARAWVNLGIALDALGRWDEALASHRRATDVDPGYAGAWLAAGRIHVRLKRLDEAMDCFQRAVAHDPEMADAHVDIAQILLQRGEFREGWERYAWRWRLPSHRMHARRFAEPEWDGGDIAGRTILVHAEQGFGDTLMFLRYVPMVAALGGRVVVEVQRSLAPLVEELPGVAAIIADGEPCPGEPCSRVDVQASVVALARIFGTDLSTIPSEPQYLWADPWRVREWAVRLESLSGKPSPPPPHPDPLPLEGEREWLRVGIVWAGNPEFAGDRERSPRLPPLLPLFDVPGVRFFILQMDDGRRDLEGVDLPASVTDLGPLIEGFADTAAIMANLDLVISSCTGPAHLAGALGRPTWVLLSYSPDWRWMLDREDSPWYPSLRLFRQPAPGDWGAVVADVTQALAGYRPPPPEDMDTADDLQREGQSHLEAHRLLESELCFRRSLVVAPGHAAALHGLGLVLEQRGRKRRALDWIDRAVMIRADADLYWHNRGAVMAALGRLDESLACYAKAALLAPATAELHYCVGRVLMALGRSHEAIAVFEQALALRPDHAETYLEIAHALLREGDFGNGFTAYLWRWRCRSVSVHRRTFAEPAWDGADPAGRTLLVLAEQGFGDTIQFARYIPLLAARGARVAFEVQAALVLLMEGLEGVAAIIPDGEPLPPFDAHVSVVDLPRLFGTEVATIPAGVPYLHPDPAAVARWAGRLACDESLKVGLVWAGNPEFADDDERSPRLAPLLPLLEVADVRFFGLQIGDGRRDLEWRDMPPSFTDLGPDIDDFVDTAAIMAGLDLVISSCTAPAHLAGALGRPVWLLLSSNPDWRWMLGRQDSPWYPSMRLFRQPAPLAWGPVVAAVAAELETLAGERRRDLAAATYATASAHHREGRLAEAEPLYRAILERTPGHADSLHMLGVLACQTGHHADAADLIAAAVAAAAPPGVAAYHSNLGEALRELGRIGEAEACYRQALALAPDYAIAHYNLANVLAKTGWVATGRAKTGRAAEAERHYRRAIELRPDDADAHNNLGILLYDLDDPAGAVACYRRALELRPDFALAATNLAGALADLGALSDALAYCRHAIALDPALAEARNALANVLRDTGHIDEAITAYREALALKPDDATIHSNLIHVLSFDPAVTGPDLLAECRRWNERQAAGLPAPSPHENRPDPDRRLRVGYVSADLRDHAVAYFLEPLIAAHDRAAVEVVCYSGSPVEDDVSRRIRVVADGWCRIRGEGDDAVAERIRADGIDILVDVSGHTRGNRLPVFARRPAPVQVSTILGQGGTTGLDAIGHILTHAALTPFGAGAGTGAEAHLAETAIRLPRTLAAFRPRADWPAVAPLPEGPPVLACFGDPARIAPAHVETWRRVLERLPGARLLLRHRAYDDADAALHWRRRFAPLVDWVDVEGLPAGGWGSAMDVYGRVMLVLDTYPVTGGTSTAIPLWMGVPVVTLAGGHAGQRFGAWLLEAVGLPELIAPDAEAFVRLAVDLLADRERLLRLRTGLRETMRYSPLCDEAGAARDVEDAYRRLWREWCARRGGGEG